MIKKILIVVCLIIISCSTAFAGAMDDLLMNGVRNNDVTMVKTALANGANINYRTNTNTPLSLAISNKNTDLVSFLLINGADPNFKVNIWGQKTTPLIIAVSNRNLKITQLLLDEGANVNDTSDAGDTPLIRAITYPTNIKLIQFLVAQKADVNQANNNGFTPLMVAAKYESWLSGQKEAQLFAAKILLKAGADPASMNNNMKTALQIAIDTNYTEMINLLLPISPK